MEHLTMQQLEDLGFTVVKSYVKDELMTQRRQRGSLIIETTWRTTGEFVSQKIKTTNTPSERPNTSSTWECFTKSEKNKNE